MNFGLESIVFSLLEKKKSSLSFDIRSFLSLYFHLQVICITASISTLSYEAHCCRWFWSEICRAFFTCTLAVSALWQQRINFPKEFSLDLWRRKQVQKTSFCVIYLLGFPSIMKVHNAKAKTRSKAVLPNTRWNCFLDRCCLDWCSSTSNLAYGEYKFVIIWILYKFIFSVADFHWVETGLTRHVFWCELGIILLYVSRQSYLIYLGVFTRYELRRLSVLTNDFSFVFL